MALPSVDPSCRMVSVRSLINEVADRQLALSTSRIEFETREKECKEMIHKMMDNVVRWTEDLRKQLLSQADAIAQRRRIEIEEINSTLACFPPKLMCLLGGDGNDFIEKQAENMRKKINDMVSEEILRELRTLRFSVSHQADRIFCNPMVSQQLMRVESSSLRPEDVRLRVIRSNEAIVLEVKSECELPLWRFLFPEFVLYVKGSSDGEGYGPITFKKLFRAGGLIILNARTFKLHVQRDQFPRSGDIIASVNLSQNPIRGSPLLVSLDSDGRDRADQLWSQVGTNANVTRTGRSTDDLDESELRAMGYIRSEQSMLNAPQLQTVRKALSTVVESSRENIEDSGESQPGAQPCVQSRSDSALRPSTRPDPSNHTSPKQDPRPTLETPPKAKFPPSSASEMLPLDQPSPVVTNAFTPAGRIDDTTEHGFTPSQVSTMMNIAERLKQIQIPSMPEIFDDPVDENGNPVQLGDDDDAVDVVLLQKNLSGDAAKQRNVSFNPQTTIMEEVGRSDSSNSTQPFKPGTMEKQFLITKGLTKEADGDMEMHKSILEEQQKLILNQSNLNESEQIWTEIPTIHEASCWNDSAITWEKKLCAMRAEHDARSAGRGPVLDVTMWDRTDSEDTWPEADRVCPAFDLSRNEYDLQCTKTIQLDGMPQSVTRDNSGRIYVTDVERNLIFRFDLWHEKTIFAEQIPFIAPRYVLALPNDDIVVLDNHALYIFDENGMLKKKLLEEEASKYRGLAHYDQYQYILTTEKTAMGVYIVLIDVVVQNEITSRICIEQTAISEWHLSRTTCRFLACCGQEGLVFTTDLGLNCVYVTSTRDRSSKIFCSLTNQIELRDPTGICVDPAGSVLVASSGTGCVQAYNSRGCHYRTFSWADVSKPGGMWIDPIQKNFYIVDIKSKILKEFQIVQT